MTWKLLTTTLPVLAFERVRFMRVSEDGRLDRHVDIGNREAGIRDGMLMRLHLPLKTTDACVFESWDLHAIKHEHHLPRGQWWYLDQRQPHAVSNQRAIERIHLVVDAYVTPALRQLLAQDVEMTI